MRSLQFDLLPNRLAMFDCSPVYFAPKSDIHHDSATLPPDSLQQPSYAIPQSSSPPLPRPSLPNLTPPSYSLTFLEQELDGTFEESRWSIFDWSEHQKSDRDSLYGSGPRPRTVHSKQGSDSRTGRTPGRRPPNTLHLRSQSVPAVKESFMDSDPAYPPAKFGTWGLGNKGVSEEWTDDFEFDESDDHVLGLCDEGLGAAGMKVPQAIIDRQESVHGQFGQVQEFMLLVEELKRLRHRGVVLNLLTGPSKQLWEDAGSIIDLATLNEDEEEHVPVQSPDLPGLFDDFDEEAPTDHQPLQHQDYQHNGEISLEPTLNLSSAPATPPAGRPRAESLAQAKSFLQTMHHNRNGLERPSLGDRSHTPKLPFDTQDLRALVAQTGVVTRALKDVVRKAEGVFISPNQTPKAPQDPPFSQMFHRRDHSPPTSTKPGLPKSTSMNSYINGSLASNSDTERARAAHMNLMTVV
jgi:hypothetical protein